MADTPRMSALKQLSSQLPVANSRVAQQQQAARDMQLQQAVKAAPVASATATNASATGAASAQQAGQQQVQLAEQDIQQQNQIGQLGQQEAQQQSQSNVASLQQGARDQQMDNAQKLASVSEEAKQEMYDKRREFTQDQLGAKFTNERQLADYARLMATSEDQWQDYQQQAEQLYARKSQMLETAYSKLSTQLEYENKTINQLQTQANDRSISQAEREASRVNLENKLKQRQELQQAQINLQKSIQREQADKANRLAKNAAIGTIAGAGVGAVFGGPAGAQIGASAGGGLATALS